MNSYTRQLSSPPAANAKSADGKFHLVAERGASFRWPYAGWNKDGKDIVKAESLEAAIAAFELTPYAVPVRPKRLVERSTLFVRRWIRAKGKESAYNALLANLPAEAKADYEEAASFSWNDPVIVGLRGVAAQALGMTEDELRACFEE